MKDIEKHLTVLQKKKHLTNSAYKMIKNDLSINFIKNECSKVIFLSIIFHSL